MMKLIYVLLYLFLNTLCHGKINRENNLYFVDEEQISEVFSMIAENEVETLILSFKILDTISKKEFHFSVLLKIEFSKDQNFKVLTFIPKYKQYHFQFLDNKVFNLKNFKEVVVYPVLHEIFSVKFKTFTKKQLEKRLAVNFNLNFYEFDRTFYKKEYVDFSNSKNIINSVSTFNIDENTNSEPIYYKNFFKIDLRQPFEYYVEQVPLWQNFDINSCFQLALSYWSKLFKKQLKFKKLNVLEMNNSPYLLKFHESESEDIYFVDPISAKIIEMETNLYKNWQKFIKVQDQDKKKKLESIFKNQELLTELMTGFLAANIGELIGLKIYQLKLMSIEEVQRLGQKIKMEIEFNLREQEIIDFLYFNKDLKSFTSNSPNEKKSCNLNQN